MLLVEKLLTASGGEAVTALYAWGNNGTGQIGNNTSINWGEPQAIGSDTNWDTDDGTLSFGGGSHVAVVKTTGALFVWGSNSAGQLGDNTVINKSSPIQVGSSTDWAYVAAGSASTFAVKTDGTLWAWGSADSGVLGDGTVVNKSSPIQIGALTNWSKNISASSSHALAIKTDGTLWSWGNNFAGQLGTSPAGTSFPRSSPVQVGALTDWSAVAAGASYSLALRSNGTLWAWGTNGNGELGDGTRISRSSPVQIGADTNWIAVATNSNSNTSFALKSNGTLWAWGNNSIGAAGDNTVVNRSSPVQVGSDTNWASIGVAAAVKTNGTLWRWGPNGSGQVGDTTNINRSSPVQIGTATDWLRINSGGSAVAQKTGGSLWSWGAGSAGQLGLNQGNVLSPVFVGNFSSAAYLSHVAAISDIGALYAWGVNTAGQLGQNTVTYFRASPVQVGSSSDWKIASVSINSTFAIKTDGTLWAWGSAAGGILGDNTVVNKSSPVQIGALTDWSTISAGVSHVLALKTNGTLWAWGQNSPGGPLGDNTIINKSSPVQIGADTNWSIIAAGTSYNLAIKTNGTLWAWGTNSSGQVGDGTSVNRSSPVQIGADTNWARVAAGSALSLAVKTNGTLWAWGTNSNGELGDGTVVFKSSPVQIGADTNWAQVMAGGGWSLAIKTDGTLWSWGLNTSGQLASGNLLPRSSPVQIGSLTAWQPGAIIANAAVGAAFLA